MTRRTETVIFHGGATLAFTDYETEQLRKALLKETRHCAVTLGMKKTSVEQLTKAVGIAKGSFYKFYESKEMLFFAVLENIHSELYGVADHALSEANGLPPSERAAKAVLAVCRRLSDTGDMVFIENDAKLLLQRLPEDIVIQSSKQVADDFHPRHCDCRKTYEYDILNRTFPLPAYRNTAYFLYGTLNIEAMRRACQAFLGEHDFASFCAAGAQVQTTVRKIYSLEVECRPLTEAGTPVPPASGEAVNAADGKHGEQVQQAQSASGEMLNAAAGESDEQVQQAQPESGETAIPAAGGANAGSADQLLTIRVKGNGFLYNMVRIIAGTLVEVGRGHIKPEEVAGIIAAKDRAKAGPTAPARGLRLVEIEYRNNL